MSLFRSSIRTPAAISDEAIERYVAAIRAQIDPDPHFRRRLRGIVLSRYVAAREGLHEAPGARLLGRLARASLYASLALGVSVTSVMAASETSVPGDLLYPLKRQIEELRVQVLPAEYHELLAAHELSERISELDVLLARGEIARAVELAPVIAHDLETLASDGAVDAALGGQLAILQHLTTRLPEPAREALDEVLATPLGAPAPAGPPATGEPDSSHSPRPSDPPDAPAGSGNDGPGAGQGNGNGNGNGTAGGDRPSSGQPGQVGGGSGGASSGGGPQPEQGGGNGGGNGGGGADAGTPAQGNGGADAGAPGQGNGGADAHPTPKPKPSKSPKP